MAVGMMGRTDLGAAGELLLLEAGVVVVVVVCCIVTQRCWRHCSCSSSNSSRPTGEGGWGEFAARLCVDWCRPQLCWLMLLTGRV
jgi:hypothetical protein